MSVNLDRFSCGYTPKPAIEVGICQACDDTIYDYEKIRCSCCDSTIHQRCESRCETCGSRGCKGEFGCLIDIDGLLFCLSCNEVQNDYKDAA